jgi:SAM-dependent methyltransferase
VTAPVGPAPVWDVINGFAAYWALRAAVDLGVFDQLADGAATAAELAGATGIADPADATLLAQLLAARGLLDTDGLRWSLTPVAARFLVSASPASMVGLVRHSPGPPAAWPALAATLRAGGPAAELRAELDALYPDLVAATAATQSGVAAGVARELRDRGLWGGTGTVVDLGCGSGAWLRALTETAHGVGVDLPHVLPAARERCPEAELVPGDYLEAALPVGRADVVVLAHVLRAESADRAAALVARALALLGARGVLLVADYFRPDGGGPAAAYAAAAHDLTLAITMRASTPGRGITEAALAGWCAASGARTVAVLEPVPRQRVHVIGRDTDPTTTGGAR